VCTRSHRSPIPLTDPVTDPARRSCSPILLADPARRSGYRSRSPILLADPVHCSRSPIPLIDPAHCSRSPILLADPARRSRSLIRSPIRSPLAARAFLPNMGASEAQYRTSFHSTTTSS